VAAREEDSAEIVNGASSRAVTRVFCSALEGFRAAERRGGRAVRHYRIAGRVVELRCAGHGLLPMLSAPFEHLRVRASSRPDLTCCAWDSASTEQPPPMRLAANGAWYRRGDGVSLDQVSPGWLEGIVPRHRLAVLWLRDPAALGGHGRATPLRRVLGWSLAGRGLLTLHAAAVGTPSGAALLAGAGGAGKSTAALACLAHGMLFASDDFVAVDLRGEATVHGLYATAWLASDVRGRLPQFDAAATGAEADKTAYDLRRTHADRLVASLPVGAVMVLVRAAATTTTWERIGAGEAFTALASATLKLMAFPAAVMADHLKPIAELVRRVPCYRLRMGNDLTLVAGAVAAALEEARG
jgi:hypothetical protein